MESTFEVRFMLCKKLREVVGSDAATTTNFSFIDILFFSELNILLKEIGKELSGFINQLNISLTSFILIFKLS